MRNAKKRAISIRGFGLKCRLMIGPPQGEKPEGTRSYAVCVSEGQVGGEDRIDHGGVLVSRRVMMTLRFSVFVALHDECAHTALVVAAKW